MKKEIESFIRLKRDKYDGNVVTRVYPGSHSAKVTDAIFNTAEGMAEALRVMKELDVWMVEIEDYDWDSKNHIVDRLYADGCTERKVIHYV